MQSFEKNSYSLAIAMLSSKASKASHDGLSLLLDFYKTEAAFLKSLDINFKKSWKKAS